MAKRPHTPIMSKRQFRAMAAARAAMEGRIDPSTLFGAARQMFESMKTRGPKSPKAHMREVAGRRFARLPERVMRRRTRQRRLRRLKKAA